MYMKLFFNSHITFPYQILIQNHCIIQMIKKMFTYNRRFRNHEIFIFLFFSLFYNSHQNIFFMCIVGFPCLTKKIRFFKKYTLLIDDFVFSFEWDTLSRAKKQNVANKNNCFLES